MDSKNRETQRSDQNRQILYRLARKQYIFEEELTSKKGFGLGVANERFMHRPQNQGLFHTLSALNSVSSGTHLCLLPGIEKDLNKGDLALVSRGKVKTAVCFLHQLFRKQLNSE